jgi:methionyl-tRNA formyltransferase
MSSRRVVFMGTPEFAAYSLEYLYNKGINIVGVVTTPDRRKGRGLKVNESEVKKVAKKLGIKEIFQPDKLKDEVFLSNIKEINPELFVVVAFRMLPKILWSMPIFGTINLHASLLPQYRGAAPINWAIINGEEVTGVTTFFIDEQIDTGKIIYRKKVEISSNDTAGTLHDKLMVEGAHLLYKTVIDIFDDKVKPLPQEEFVENTELKLAPKIFKEDCKINWDNEVVKIYNFIRGLSPYPGAWTKMMINKDGKENIIETKILFGEYQKIEHNLLPGTVIQENKILKVAAKDGFLIPTRIKPQSKKEMDNQAFLNGYFRLNIKFE